MKFYIGVALNAAIGYYLLMVNPDAIPTIVYWCLVIAVALAAVLSIISFGTLALGWAFMMEDTETENYQPGQPRAIQLYDATINMLAGYTKTRFYASFAASVMLMAGLAAQGWVFILVLEVLGSAVGYGFLHWVMNNNHKMHERTHGSE